MRTRDKRAIERRAKVLGVKHHTDNEPHGWELCTRCGGIISPTQAAHRRLKGYTHPERPRPIDLWEHDGCRQGTIGFYRCLGRPVAGWEDLYRPELDEQFKRWYAYLTQERRTKVQHVAAICDMCQTSGYDLENPNKCERCGRGACPHRYRDGQCAPCWVASRQSTDGEPAMVPGTKAKVTGVTISEFPDPPKLVAEKPMRESKATNPISAALNGLSMTDLGNIAEKNGVQEQWRGWATKFANNPGMARMQLNGALRRIEAKGGKVNLDPMRPSERAMALSETPKQKKQREAAFAAHKAREAKKPKVKGGKK